jgi:uncharacterized protein YukE
MPENKVMEPTQGLVEAFSGAAQVITKSVVAAQERNMRFMQSTFTGTVELLQSHIEATRVLMKDLEKQQEAFQKMVPGWGGGQWMEVYRDMLRAPFSAYQQALGAVEKTTREGMETFEKAVEDFDKAAKQPGRAAGK